MNVRTLCLLLSLPFLTQCKAILYPDRIVQQGNYLPAEKVKQVKLGMSKAEVESILGSSLLPNDFDKDRLDYAFSYQKGAGPKIRKKLSLTFKHDRLTEIRA